MTATVSQPAQNAVTDAPVENGAKTSGGIQSQDVGLIFVREYYTFLNKNPHKLYGFYGNDSLMVRGDEGEVAQTIRGKEEIRKKIDELGFNDCRVLVTQVDSQVSASNGLLIQVLGEMCNMDAPVQKFSQTFFLAPQPNGYYVLNDIFRCLKDDVDIDYYTCDENNKQTTTTNTTTTTQQPKTAAVPVVAVKQQQQQPETPLPASETSAASTTASIGAAPTIATTATTVTTTEAGELDSTAATTASTPVIESAQTPVADAVEEPKESEEKPVAAPAPAQQQQQRGEKTTTASEKKSNAPQTWANLAAGRNEPKWGGAATAAPATPEPKGSSASSTAPQQQQQQSKPKSHDHREPVPKEEMTEVFLKNTKNVTVEQVKEVFGAEFGEVKSVTLNPHPRNNGFLNFAVPESCQKALNQRKVTVGETTVLVEERRTPTNKFNRQNGGSYGERKYQQNQHRRGGGAPRGGGNKPRGGGNQKQQQ